MSITFRIIGDRVPTFVCRGTLHPKIGRFPDDPCRRVPHGGSRERHRDAELETKETRMRTSQRHYEIAGADPPRSRRRVVLGAAFVAIVALAATFTTVPAADADQRDLARVRGAVAPYHDTDRAMVDGWEEVPGLDHCFANEELGGMGFHLIDVSRLDTALDPHRPEALVYVPKPNGELRLGAVEWIVPADSWADEGHADPPEILDQQLHLNEALGVYVLHAWIFEHNPAGMFEDFNPRVSCP
jgi:hypothetical protein